MEHSPNMHSSPYVGSDVRKQFDKFFLLYSHKVRHVWRGEGRVKSESNRGRVRSSIIQIWFENHGFKSGRLKLDGIIITGKTWSVIDKIGNQCKWTSEFLGRSRKSFLPCDIVSRYRFVVSGDSLVNHGHMSPHVAACFLTPLQNSDVHNHNLSITKITA